MDLTNVRNEINDIDIKMQDLFFKRMECSSEVARVKMSNNDEIYKPDREKQIIDNYEGNNKNQYSAFIKNIMQISRIKQYSIFLDNGFYDDTFFEWLGKDNIRACDNGGILKLDLKLAGNGERALDNSEVLFVIASTTLDINKISLCDNAMSIEIIVPNDNELKAIAYALCYLLYKETIVSMNV